MNSTGNLDKCFSFINTQLSAPAFGRAANPARRYRALTISRQSGSGAHVLAETLAAQLPERWAVFDRNLVEQVLADHNLPARLARFMPEDRISELTDVMDELFGLHPATWSLVRQTSETILRLAKLGNVILIGRGANVITNRLPDVFHVRLVGSLEKRAQRLQKSLKLERPAALSLAQREDRARRRYLKQFFGKDIQDPLLYHLIINTDLSTPEEAAAMLLLELSSGLSRAAA